MKINPIQNNNYHTYNKNNQKQTINFKGNIVATTEDICLAMEKRYQKVASSITEKLTPEDKTNIVKNIKDGIANEFKEIKENYSPLVDLKLSGDSNAYMPNQPLYRIITLIDEYNRDRRVPLITDYYDSSINDIMSDIMRVRTESRFVENAEALLRNYSQGVKSRMLGINPEGKSYWSHSDRFGNPIREYFDKDKIHFRIEPGRGLFKWHVDDYQREIFVHRDLIEHVKMDWDKRNNSRVQGNFSIDMYHLPYFHLSTEEQMIEMNKKLQATREFFDNRPELLTSYYNKPVTAEINDKLNAALKMSNEITNKINAQKYAQEVSKSNSELEVDLKSLADEFLMQA